MEIPKPSGADKERFRSLAPGDPRVEVKAMFGNLGAFVNGNMFMGLFSADIGVSSLRRTRTSSEARKALAGSDRPRDRWADT